MDSLKVDINLRGRKISVQETPLDKAVRWISPSRGLRRFQDRVRAAAITGGYIAGRRDRNATKGWNHSGGDPDTDVITDLPTMRERSRDHTRNNPIACGAVNTNLTNVVGPGLQLFSNIDRDVLKMTEDEADEWEANAERWFGVWATNPSECDAARTLSFYAQQGLSYRQTMENGDVFVNKPWIERVGCHFGLKLQVIEADRVCNENSGSDTATLSAGVQFDPDTGEPVRYHVAKFHPGSLKTVNREWTKIDAFNEDGKRNIYHLYHMLRPNQHRGVPYLAPVIEPLKQLGNMTESELQSAVLQSVFTVFVTTEDGQGELSVTPSDNSTATSTEDSVKLGSGNIIGTQPGQKVEFANPTRPNTAFDPFFLAIVRQIGMALEIPYEILIKHFTASYSAARAALQEAWKFFSTRRKWLVDMFCQPVYCDWMDEAVARDFIQAPGYFEDPIIRQAYQRAIWIGPAKGMIQEQQEVAAAKERIALLISTRQFEAAQLMGLDSEQVLKIAAREQRRIKRLGLPSLLSPQSMLAEPKPSSENRQPQNPDDPDQPEKPEQGDRELPDAE